SGHHVLVSDTTCSLDSWPKCPSCVDGYMARQPDPALSAAHVNRCCDRRYVRGNHVRTGCAAAECPFNHVPDVRDGRSPRLHIYLWEAAAVQASDQHFKRVDATGTQRH